MPEQIHAAILHKPIWAVDNFPGSTKYVRADVVESRIKDAVWKAQCDLLKNINQFKRQHEKSLVEEEKKGDYNQYLAASPNRPTGGGCGKNPCLSAPFMSVRS